MRQVLTIVGVIALTYLLYERWFNPPKPVIVVVTNTVPVRVEVPVRPADNYTKRVSKLFDSIYAPLDTAVPNPTAEFERIKGTCRQQMQSDGVDGELAKVCFKLCNNLLEANGRREELQKKYANHRSCPIDTLEGGISADQKRRFFLDNDVQQWVSFAVTSRNELSPLLAKVAELEEKATAARTASATLAVPPTPPAVSLR